MNFQSIWKALDNPFIKSGRVTPNIGRELKTNVWGWETLQHPTRTLLYRSNCKTYQYLGTYNGQSLSF